MPKPRCCPKANNCCDPCQRPHRKSHPCGAHASGYHSSGMHSERDVHGMKYIDDKVNDHNQIKDMDSIDDYMGGDDMMMEEDGAMEMNN